MSDAIQSPYTIEQTTTWVRGLVALAWADGHFDPEEQEIITELLHQDLSEAEKATALEPVADAELARVLGQDAKLAEDFLRTAVMVALADGDYSESEDALLLRYCQVLNQKPEAIQVLRSTFQALAAAQPESGQPHGEMLGAIAAHPDDHLDVLHPVREWLDTMDIQDPKVARMLCKLIPSQCPFERDITLFGRKLVHIPPLCKINPLYEQLVGLRFRALSYLADDCGEDVSTYV
ncbi:MAG: Mo-dependent nitrogenase C-terminal domain-containing protein [Leptolyngbyaceae cyanobacterium bins.302]|nr:Mo-dependent nitrogenase C-terminal domain-containing protein [Leptolyngbyaceae cyanobacterium bins.302]